MSFTEELLHHKKVADTQYVFSLYSDVNLFLEYKLDKSFITDGNTRLYYMILEQMIEKKNYQVIDSVNVEVYMGQQSDKLQKLFERAGGWSTIAESMNLIEANNIDVYYKEVMRYEALRKLNMYGYDIQSEWAAYNKLSYEELAATVEDKIGKIFAEGTTEEKVLDFKHDIRGMIKKADEGLTRGLPLYSRMLNATVNGMALGNITMVAGASGAGKTNFTLNQALTAMIQNEEKLLVMCNEEELAKWQQDMLTWHINNIQEGDFIKSRFHQGDFSADEHKSLDAAVEWMEEKLEDGLIQFVNFNTFSMDKSIRLMRRYIIQENVRYFIIDTLKLDNDLGSSLGDNSWLQLQQNMVKLYNVVKPSAHNCHVWVTYQLTKTQRTRFLDQTSLGMSKNVADVVSTLILIRNVLESEKGSDGLLIKKKRDREAKPLLKKEAEYMIAFIDKNRRGSTENQLVFKVDKGRNTMKDIGFTKVAQDY